MGLDYWRTVSATNDPRAELAEKRSRCYGLVLDSLTFFEQRPTDSNTRATDDVAMIGDPESVRSHAYELAFSSEDEMFHSTLYDWLINRNLADDLLEVSNVDNSLKC